MVPTENCLGNDDSAGTAELQFPMALELTNLKEDLVTDQPAIADSETAAASPFRWQWGVGIFTFGCVLEALVWFYFAPDRTYQVFFSLPVVSGTVFFTTLWWLFASGLPLMTRVIGIVVLAGAALGFRSQYRIKEFRGDMTPVFVSTSELTDEEKLDAYLKTVESTAPPSVASADNGQGEDATDESGTATDPPRLEISNGDWPQFRGPERDGIVDADLSNVDWQQAPAEVWRHPVGKGWSSFAIVGGLAFTQEQRGDNECVVCYEAMTGKQVWEHADAIRFDEAMGGPGPRATPTIVDSRLYSLGATGQLNCLDPLSGRKLWARNILDDAKAVNLKWAMSGSPLIVDGRVIVIPGGENDHGVAAYDAESGEPIWSSGSAPASYAAPTLANLHGKQTLLAFHGIGLSGHDLSDGKLLWTVPWENDPKINAAEPVVVDDSSVLIATGYGQGATLIRVQQDGDNWSGESAWSERRFKLKFNAPVRQGEYVYGLSEGILMCLNLGSGKIEWKKGRYGYGQLLLAGDVLIVLAENGDIAYVAAQPDDYEELGRYPALDGKTWNHPVIWNGHLFARNGEEAACFKLSR